MRRKKGRADTDIESLLLPLLGDVRVTPFWYSPGSSKPRAGLQQQASWTAGGKQEADKPDCTHPETSSLSMTIFSSGDFWTQC